MTRNWDNCRDEIRKLYLDDKKTLDEVIRLMKGKHNLHASERTYKTQLRKWGYMKNNTENFPRHRLKKRRRSQVQLPAGQGRPTDSFSSPNIVPDQLVAFDSLQSLPTASQTYSHSPQTWQFETTPNNGESASNNHYATFRGALTEINLPSGDQSSLSLNAQDLNGRTQLHRAVIDGSEERVKTLLFNGIAVDIKDQAHNEPLHYAVLGGSVTMIELLLRFGADIDSKGHLGRSPMHMSVTSELMLATFLKCQAIVSSQDEKGDTPLHLALSSAALEDFPRTNAIKMLVDAGADINMANTAGVTPFHIVVDHPDVDEEGHIYSYIKLFLESGANLSLKTRDNRSPLEVFLGRCSWIWAIQRRHSWAPHSNTCFRLFLSNGADPETRLQSGERLVQYFIQEKSGHMGADPYLAELLCKMADPGILRENGNYLLHDITANARREYDARSYTAKLVRIVLDKEADPNQRNRSGQTPLMTLLSSGTHPQKEVAEAFELLLARGAVPMLRDSLGNLPIYETVTNFPRTAWKFGKALLRYDKLFEEDANESRNTGSILDDRRWWQTWELVRKDTDWEIAKDRLRNAQDSLPAKVRKQIYTIALGVLAELYLKSAKERFTAENSNLDEHRKYVAAILRDYRQLPIETDPVWIEYLLDLCK